MKRNRILVVEDESVRLAIRDFLVGKDYEVMDTDTCAGAAVLFDSFHPDLVISDYELPDGTALDLLAGLRSHDESVPWIVLTGHGSIELAVQAIKLGADNFLTKPVRLDALLIVVQRTIETQKLRQRQLATRAGRSLHCEDPFAGKSAAMRQLAEEAKRILPSDSSVLIQGETGSGKGVLARWLHSHGPRADEAFVDLNCVGLSRELLESELFGHEKGAFTGAVSVKQGLFEVAHRGTVFLDEIADVDLQIQPKLLKVLEEKQFRRVGDVRDRRVDVRLIAASHQDFAGLVREKKFRSDLYFRISTIPLRVPALRERVEDIPLIAGEVLRRLGTDLSRPEARLEPDALHLLCSYSWPGNVRELRNVLERTLLLSEGNVLGRKDLRFEATFVETPSAPADMTLSDLERFHIHRVLEKEGWHVGRAARKLAIPRSSLYAKIKEYGISIPARGLGVQN
jgi:DNA-binding NtrC family response regulator